MRFLDIVLLAMSSSISPIALPDFVKAVQDLSDENLLSIQKQLHTSLQKLAETNAELEVASGDEADKELFQSTILENNEVIHNQEDRLKALELELARRGQAPTEEGLYL